MSNVQNKSIIINIEKLNRTKMYDLGRCDGRWDGCPMYEIN